MSANTPPPKDSITIALPDKADELLKTIKNKRNKAEFRMKSFEELLPIYDNHGLYEEAYQIAKTLLRDYPSSSWTQSLVAKYKLASHRGLLSKYKTRKSNLVAFKITSTTPSKINHYDLKKSRPIKYEDPFFLFPLEETNNQITHEIYDLSDCFLSIDFSKKYQIDYYVFDSEKRHLPDLSRGENPFLFQRITKSYDMNVSFADDKFTNFNICHLWADKIPRALEINDYDSSINTTILLTNNRYCESSVLQMGLNPLRLDNKIGNRHTYQFKRLVFSTSGSKTFRHPNSLGYPFLQRARERYKNSATVAQSASQPKIIYIDRSDAPTRQVINQAEIDTVLERYGALKFSPKNLTLEEQQSLFVNADIIIGPHGAGLTNIIFSLSTTIHLIEILSPKYATDAFARITNYIDGKYLYVVGSETNKFDKVDYTNFTISAGKNNQDNFYVSPEELERKILEARKQ